MKVAYRRMSGAIGISRFEQGERGLWFEKRIALVKAIKTRGNSVEFVNRMTKFSNAGTEIPLREDHDLLIVEFGSSNKAFYGDDLKKTTEYINKFKGKIVFVCDDPDLPLNWKDINPEVVGRIICWYNCAYPAPFGSQPENIKAKSFPISGLIPCAEVQPSEEKELVYIGRPKGREKVFKELFVHKVPLKIYGRKEEWKDFEVEVEQSPQQVHRAQFYSTQLGSLMIADKKHKRLGWYTGRAFHAINAGCPAIAEQDHHGMKSLRKFETPTELKEIIQDWIQNPQEREFAWRAQRDWVNTMRVECEERFAELGL